jgi:hypothetical protein
MTGRHELVGRVSVNVSDTVFFATTPYLAKIALSRGAQPSVSDGERRAGALIAVEAFACLPGWLATFPARQGCPEFFEI